MIGILLLAVTGMHQTRLVLNSRASCSRLRFLELVLKLESGDHINCKDTEVVDCIAYRLEPLSDNSHNDLDGELIEPGPIQACVVPSGAQFFAGKVANQR
jgi:diacylglycerol kinase family enzyme